MISTVTSTQSYKGVGPVIRKHMTHLFIYRLRHDGDLEGIIEDLSAIYDKKTLLLQIYHEAVSEDSSSLYVNLISMDKRKVFMKQSSHDLNPS